MQTDEGLLSASNRPDLEEFLSALNGFLSKQTTPGDPSYVRFLEIFFRSVKTNKGHLLRMGEDGVLTSVASYGIGRDFDRDFNRAHAQAVHEPSPLDVAFLEKDAVAVVDISKDPDVPHWFLNVMNQYGFNSLVAVPLVGAEKPIGILCAYYDDVCLFDRATLNHLVQIGRMVGGATEKSLVADKAESHGEQEKIADQFLRILTSSACNKLQVYSLLTKMVKEAIDVAGVIAGPVKKSGESFSITIAGVAGVSDKFVTHNLMLPPFIGSHFSSSRERNDFAIITPNQWGPLKAMIPGQPSVALYRAIPWQTKIQGAVVAWRMGTKSFTDDDQLVLGRLVGISSLALNAA